MMDDLLRRHLDEVADKCLHCGLCLPVCPTYAISLREESSPRGRIRMMKSLNDNSLALSKPFIDEMYFCLDCQACQTACPAGVRYGELVENARVGIAESGRDPGLISLLKKFFLRGILATPARTKYAASFLRLYTRSGIRDAVDSSGILSVLPGNAAELHKLLPPVDERPFDESVPDILIPEGEVRGRVGFLTGCIMNVSFAGVHRDALSVLLANGFEVVIPHGQVCCGSLHAHNGDMHEARRLAATNVEVFSRQAIDALIIDSAGCGAFVKEYGKLFIGDQHLADKAAALSERTRDITEFLSQTGMRPFRNPVPARIAYHEACHLVHSQGISQQPRDILKSIPGIELIDLPEATWCCGSAGIYNISRYGDAIQLLERKMRNIAATGAEIVLAANPGCQIQIGYGAGKFEVPVRVLHPVSILAMAYGYPARGDVRAAAGLREEV